MSVLSHLTPQAGFIWTNLTPNQRNWWSEKADNAEDRAANFEYWVRNGCPNLKNGMPDHDA